MLINMAIFLTNLLNVNIQHFIPYKIIMKSADPGVQVGKMDILYDV
jgi:hypothetical protein